MKKCMIMLTFVSAIASIDMIHASAPAAAAAAGAGAGNASAAHGNVSLGKEAQENANAQQVARIMAGERISRIVEKAIEKLSNEFVDTFKSISPTLIETYFIYELFVYPSRPPYDQMFNVKIPYVRIDKSNWAIPICDHHFALAQYNTLKEKIEADGNKLSDQELIESRSISLNPKLEKILQEKLATKKLIAADASAAYPT